MLRCENAQKLCVRAKVQKEADLEIRCPQVIMELSLGDGMEHGRGFHLHDHRGIDDEVEALEAERLSLIPDLHRMLARNVMSRSAQISFERRAIQALQESIPKRSVHFVECPYDYAGQFVVREIAFCHGGRCLAQRQRTASFHFGRHRFVAWHT